MSSRVTDAPEPEGGRTREVLAYWSGEGRFVPIVVPPAEGLREAAEAYPADVAGAQSALEVGQLSAGQWDSPCWPVRKDMT